ncbi:proteasome assembly chaperone 3-like [Amphiura filiformis]|uniref:proteasome assembly chaperone 3-like n=1 Tax=Amphiura filiformis TaxID=82378 RepID=UPI003B21B479
MPDSSSIPRTKQGAAIIDGIHTDIVCTAFDDQTLLVITQYQKLGTLVQVTRDADLPEDRNTNFTSKVLLGKDEPLTHVYATNIASKVCNTPNSKPLLLAMSLKQHSPAILKTLQDLIMEYQVW